MIVVSMTDCPPALRGDLTKWLFEINVGVYVGQVSARVRDELWNRIVENCKVGRVTMVYQTNNEQHFAFRVHNSDWKPIDFDGLTLMLRPVDSYANRTSSLRPGFSKAAQRQIVKRIQNAEMKRAEKLNESEIEIENSIQAPHITDNQSIHTINDFNHRTPIQNINSPISIVQNPVKENTPGMGHTEPSESKPIKPKRTTTNAVQDFHPARSASAPIEIVVDENSNQKKTKRAKRTESTTLLKSESHKMDTGNRTYVVIDLETTGLDENEHEILEFGALRITDGQIIDKFQRLVLIDNDIPPFISKLTGITDDMIDESGVPLKDALAQFIAFIGNDLLLGHNIEFDMKFIRAALKRCRVAPITNKTECTLELARKRLQQCKSHKLKSLVSHFHIEASGEHRSLADCESVFHLYEILKRM